MATIADTIISIMAHLGVLEAVIAKVEAPPDLTEIDTKIVALTGELTAKIEQPPAP